VGDRVASFLSGQVILVTGVTGFLGKPLVEKLLRAVPDIGHVYLLIRAKPGFGVGAATAEERFHREVLSSGVFGRLREEWGRQFVARIAEKVTAVPGDLTLPRLGLADDVHAELTARVSVVINSAAVVVFDAPLDSAIDLNAVAAERVVEFTRSCRDAILLHVSTAYVNGRNPSSAPERVLPRRSAVPDRWAGPVLPDDPFAEIERLRALCEDVDAESRLPRRARRFLRAATRDLAATAQADDPEALERQIDTMRLSWCRGRLIHVGMQQANARGWNDTYTFTKALGEQAIAETRGDLPVVIIRPSIIESSFAEPEPGWIDGYRMADPLIIGFGKARVPDFPGSRDVLIDLVPVDWVVNAILTTAWRAADARGLQVYHVSTGDTNPMTFGVLYESSREYFRTDPMLDRQGHPVVTTSWTFPTLATFQRRLRWWRLRPVKMGIRLLGVLPLPKTRRLRQRLITLKASIERLSYYASIYSPYVSRTYIFDTAQTRVLFDRLTADEQETWQFPLSSIDWPRYLKETHIPGLKRNVLKMGASRMKPPIAEEAALTDDDSGPGADL
jgi:nucleoside-diphosphate-sugar epimerase